MLKHWVTQLEARAERQRAEHKAVQEEQARAEAEAARARLVTLDTRLARLLSTIPTEVQAEGLSLPALQAQLRARGRGHTVCQAGELGTALRRLGYVRERRWRGGEGFRALWFLAR